MGGLGMLRSAAIREVQEFVMSMQCLDCLRNVSLAQEDEMYDVPIIAPPGAAVEELEQRLEQTGGAFPVCP